MTEPRVQATTYTVTCMPDPGPPDAHVFAVLVTRHRDGGWSVGDGGGWCYAGGPHVREATCHTAHRYGKREALDLAKAAAPHVAAPALEHLARLAEKENTR